MFDIGATELLLIFVVAVIAIGRDDMPLALRTFGRYVGKLRRLSAQFRAGIDSVVRDAELQDMEKQWKAQNEKIMREHPQGAPAEMEPTGAYPAAAVTPKAVGAEAPPQTMSAERAAELKIIAEKQKAAAAEAERAASEAEAQLHAAKSQSQAQLALEPASAEARAGADAEASTGAEGASSASETPGKGS